LRKWARQLDGVHLKPLMLEAQEGRHSSRFQRCTGDLPVSLHRILCFCRSFLVKPILASGS
jgi:hypothetical protein